jgi:uncharacterized protein (TIGR01244 family)
MSRNCVRLCGAIAALIILTTAAAAQSEQRYVELPNFQRVNERLYRGGQPQEGGFPLLARLGIKTVVNLRAADEHACADQARAQAAGLAYFNVPMASHARPTDEQVERVLAIIEAEANQPVFVYCKRGADRTGLVMAVYRIARDGWTSGMAKAEANRHGMFVTQLEMKAYITDYYCRRAGVTADCVGRHFVDEFGTAAAVATRRIVEEVGAHPITRKGIRQVKRLLH